MNKIVLYFSASNITKKKAIELANLLNCDIEEIKPETPYSTADLDWTNKNSRSSIEMNDSKSRPNILKLNHDLINYDTIILGFPIWWYVEPKIIDTFLDNYNLENKKIIVFATSGGSSITSTFNHLKESYKNYNFIKGILLNNSINKTDFNI